MNSKDPSPTSYRAVTAAAVKDSDYPEALDFFDALIKFRYSEKEASSYVLKYIKHRDKLPQPFNKAESNSIMLATLLLLLSCIEDKDGTEPFEMSSVSQNPNDEPISISIPESTWESSSATSNSDSDSFSSSDNSSSSFSD
jgi:hypothetical protein